MEGLRRRGFIYLTGDSKMTSSSAQFMLAWISLMLKVWGMD